MTDSAKKTNGNSSTGKPKPKRSPTHAVDSQHADVKYAESLGRVDIAPAKPLWPSKK